LPRLLSLNGGAIDRPKNVPDGLQNRYPARGQVAVFSAVSVF
jgi:hypothetical protein